ncbi:MAG: stage III sporulation protein AE [Clostridium sp.]|nr:stage III sporulation protein AE [Clostridium sp.]
MKKIIFFILIFGILFCPYKVEAAQNDTNYNQNTEEVNKLYDYITNMKTKYELLNDMDVQDYVSETMKSGSGKFSIKKLMGTLIKYIFTDVIASLKLMTMLLIICVMCAMLTNLQKAFSNESLSNIAYFACYSLIIIIISKSFYVGVTEVKDAIKSITDFMGAIMPVLLILMASSGGMVQSATMDPVIIFVIDFTSTIFTDVLLPLIIFTFVLQFVNNISKDYKVDKLAQLLKQLVLWIEGIFLTVFIGIITIRGISSKAMDEVTSRTAKFAVDNFVPIVGKCLSDAISTVAGYSGLLKNAVSSVGLIVIALIVLLPIIKVFVLAFIHKFTAAVVEPISDSRIVNCINAAGDTLILLASSLISISVMFFILIAMIASSATTAV